MKKKLFVFFIIFIFLIVGITGLVYYKLARNLIIENTRKEIETEILSVADYIKENEEENFNSISKLIKEKTNKKVLILSNDGILLGDSESNVKKFDNNISRNEFKDAIKYGVGESVKDGFTENKYVYYYVKKIIVNDNTYLVRLETKIDTIKELQVGYFNVSIITILVALLLIIIFVHRYIGSITKPIEKLTKFATTISIGNYDKRIKLSSKDEIGKLGNAFNLMAQRLEDTIANLGDKQNKLMTILSNSKDGIIVLDNNKRILLLNPAAQAMFDLENDIIGKYFIEVIRNYDLENIIENVPNEEVEIKLNYPSIKNVKIRATNAISYENMEEVLGVLIIVQDITKVKKLENIRSDFAANVSHELKTPLTSIKGFCETLRVVDDKETRNKFLDIINIESERLTNLINDILTLSELESGLAEERHTIDVNKCISEVYTITKQIASKKDIEIDYIENDKNCAIFGDEYSFKQMIINLVDNAIKYTEEDGNIYIYLTKNNESLIIKVEDTGIGISSEHFPRLFERFYRVDKGRSRDSGGTGLGLAIVKHIVILLNGEIEVESEVNKGTTFTITLPCE